MTPGGSSQQAVVERLPRRYGDDPLAEHFGDDLYWAAPQVRG